VAFATFTDKPEDGHGRVVEKFKIAYAFVQVVSSGFEEFNVVFPPAFSRVVSTLSIVNLDIFGFLSIGCIVDFNFYDELLATCVGPAVVALLAFGYAACRAKAEKKGNGRSALQKVTSFYLVLLFCVYAGVTRKVRRAVLTHA